MVMDVRVSAFGVWGMGVVQNNLDTGFESLEYRMDFSFLVTLLKSLATCVAMVMADRSSSDPNFNPAMTDPHDRSMTSIGPSG